MKKSELRKIIKEEIQKLNEDKKVTLTVVGYNKLGKGPANKKPDVQQILNKNKMDNFDLRKYLAEGKLFEEDFKRVKSQYINSKEEWVSLRDQLSKEGYTSFGEDINDDGKLDGSDLNLNKTGDSINKFNPSSFPFVLHLYPSHKHFSVNYYPFPDKLDYYSSHADKWARDVGLY